MPPRPPSGRPPARRSGKPAGGPAGSRQGHPGKPTGQARGKPASDRPDRSEARPARVDRPPAKSGWNGAKGGTKSGARSGDRDRPDRPERARTDHVRADRGRPDRDRPERDRPERDRSEARPARFDRSPGRGERARPDHARPDHARPGQGRADQGRAGRDDGGDRAERPERRAKPPLRPAASRKVAEGAMELLDAISGSREPGDRVRHVWMHKHHRRYEAPERDALIHLSDEVLRLRGRLDWWISPEGPAGRLGLPPDNRLRVAAYRILSAGAKAANLLPLFPASDPAVGALLQYLEGHNLDHPDMPPAAHYSVPDWLLPQFRSRFGADLDLELAAMLRPASLDVRINTLKTTRQAAGAELAAEDLRSQPTPFSPYGLRLSPHAYVNNTRAYAEGLVEPQDEGSQIAAQLVDAAGCKFVVDFCAGAGGKTLVLAAAMKNSGRLVAMDVSTGRLNQAKLRLRRAGVHNAETRELETKWLKRHAGKAERVLVDAPCSGTGTWRRKPDAKWRLLPKDIDELVPRQAEILDRAAKLVRSGGRLIYVTCSVLRVENEEQVAAFLKRHPDFTTLHVDQVWGHTVGGACPVPGPYLNLTPARHGTDGFFAAILVRKPD